MSGQPMPHLAHLAHVEQREGVRGPVRNPSYRWVCRCGEAGRWTRQWDTALGGALRHDAKMGTA